MFEARLWWPTRCLIQRTAFSGPTFWRPFGRSGVSTFGCRLVLLAFHELFLLLEGAKNDSSFNNTYHFKAYFRMIPNQVLQMWCLAFEIEMLPISDAQKCEFPHSTVALPVLDDTNEPPTGVPHSIFKAGLVLGDGVDPGRKQAKQNWISKSPVLAANHTNNNW